MNWVEDSGLPHWYQKIVKWIEPKTQAYHIGTRRLLSELRQRLRLTTLVPEDFYVNWAEDSGLPHWYQKIVMWIERKTQAYHIGTRRLLSELFESHVIWIRSRRCGCLVTWFCYQMIAKPGNKTAAPSWPDPCNHYKIKHNKTFWITFNGIIMMSHELLYGISKQ